MSTDPRYQQQLDQAAAIIARLSDEDVQRIATAVVARLELLRRDA